MMVVGCILSLRNGNDRDMISAAKTTTEVVPSPTSSSWVRAISMSILAAGFWTVISRKMALPSLVMTIPPIGSISILSMALGPRQVRIKSPTALVDITLLVWILWLDSLRSVLAFNANMGARPGPPPGIIPPGIIIVAVNVGCGQGLPAEKSKTFEILFVN